MLLQLVDSSMPDHRTFTHESVIGNYLTSPQSLKAIEDTITKAENLRDSDSRFSTLGIGLAEGEWIVEFDLLGRLNPKHMLPVGGSLSDAVRVGREPQCYQKLLQTLRKNVLKCAA